MKELDLRGLSCPEPVLILKSEIEKNASETFKVLVNEAHTVKNITVFANSVSRKVSSKEIGSEYELIIE